MCRPSIVFAGVPVLTLVGILAVAPSLTRDPHGDFVEYWAAGRLNLAGDNPYDPSRMLAVEREVGWRVPYPMMMWNPPWTLTFGMPLGRLPFSLARGIWVVCQFAISLGCGITLWRFYGGPSRGEWAAISVTALFAPLLLSLRYGQIGPLVLLGLTGFLVAQSRRRDVLAGAFLSFASVKPHLVYAIWLAVLAWSLWSGRWRVLAGLAIAIVALAVIPTVANPAVFDQFFRIIAERPATGENFRSIQDWGTPTFGWQLRLLFGKAHFQLQYVPTLLGLLWLGRYMRWKQQQWDWAEQLPLLLLMSVCTAAYGAWPADSLVLLPALIAVSAGLSTDGDRERMRIGVAVFLILGLLTLVIERRPTTELYVWVPLLYWTAYVFLKTRRQDYESCSLRLARRRTGMPPPAKNWETKEDVIKAIDELKDTINKAKPVEVKE